jgi:hypothetical protein
MARLRERLAEDFASRLRQLHRAVDLGFPEFTRHMRTLESQLAATILSRCPTAASFSWCFGEEARSDRFTTARTRAARNWRAP